MPELLIGKLLGRRNYLKQEDNELKGKAKKRSRKFNLSNIQDGNLLSKEEEIMQNKLKNSLIERYRKGNKDDAEVQGMMKQSFRLLRKFLAIIESQSELIDNWPYLTHTVCIQNYIMELKVVDIGIFVQLFEEQKPRILKFMSFSKLNKIVQLRNETDKFENIWALMRVCCSEFMR